MDTADRTENERVERELARVEKRRTGRKRIVGGVVSAAIIGVTFAYPLPKIADYSQVWDVVKTLSWGWIVALVVITTINVLSNAPPCVAALPALGIVNAMADLKQATSKGGSLYVFRLP